MPSTIYKISPSFENDIKICLQALAGTIGHAQIKSRVLKGISDYKAAIDNADNSKYLPPGSTVRPTPFGQTAIDMAVPGPDRPKSLMDHQTRLAIKNDMKNALKALDEIEALTTLSGPPDPGVRHKPAVGQVLFRLLPKLAELRKTVKAAELEGDFSDIKIGLPPGC